MQLNVMHINGVDYNYSLHDVRKLLFWDAVHM